MAQDPEPSEPERAPDEDAPRADHASPENALTAALAAAQAVFPPIEKRHTAEVRGKDGKPGYTYSYADLGDVLGAVRPVLAAQGLAVVQRTVPDGQRVRLVTELRHVAGGRLDTEVDLGQSSGNPQAFGGALTYLRRYELVTLLGIAAEEDRDAQDVPVAGRAAPAPEVPPWARPATDARKRELVNALEVIIGRDAAKSLGATIASTLGQVPDVVVSAAKGILAHYTHAEPAGVAERHAAAFEAQAAATARARQDDDAERADTPAPEPDTDPPGEGVDAEPVADEDDAGEPPSDLELEVGANVAAGGEERPPAGTVELPVRKDGEAPVDHLKRLRAAGCICPQPLGDVGEPRKIDDGCPLNGHGIPF